MISKVNYINNIGRYDSFTWSAPSLGKKNIFFANNGDGKSTLTAILRSYETSEPMGILEKTSFGSNKKPTVEITFKNPKEKIVHFVNDRWEAKVESILIFDSHFISKNIFDSEKYMDQHRSNLHRIVIGEEGKLLAENIEKLVIDLREKEQKLIEIRHFYSREAFSTVIGIDEYVKLKTDMNIDKKIASLQTKKEYKSLVSLPLLNNISISFPANFEEIISKDHSTAHKTAEALLIKHISDNWKDKTHDKKFLAEGIAIIKDKNCPFCGQDLRMVKELIEAYKSYFDITFFEWQDNIKLYLKVFKNCNLSLDINQLRQSIDTWSKYLPEESSDILQWLSKNTPEILKMKTKFDTECERKDKNIQYHIDFSNYRSLKRQLDILNALIQKLNKAIDKYKSNIDSKADIEIQILKAEAIKVRGSKKWMETCSLYSKLTAKLIIEKALRDKKIQELRIYSEAIFKSHQLEINNILKAVGADFIIENLSAKTDRRKADPTYCGFELIFFNKHKIITDLDQPGIPNINNTLSLGDKNLLAFAFFISLLINDKKLKEKIVVIDDPISSLDHERKLGIEHILALLKNIKDDEPNQLIIFTHELGFLSYLYGDYTSFGNTHASYYEIFPDGTSSKGNKTSSIKELNPQESLLKAESIKNYEKIIEWEKTTSTVPNEATSMCRILLEDIIKQKYWPFICDTAFIGGGLREFIDVLKKKGIYKKDIIKEIETSMPNIRRSHHSASEIKTSVSQGDIKTLLRSTLSLAQKI